ncbi:hypothetical protein [Brevundimonas sp.]|uniref:hypothetical protein n=1 Tax=Brevundimonas sp. TaxID=1871086 RepID=UPI002FDB8A60
MTSRVLAAALALIAASCAPAPIPGDTPARPVQSLSSSECAARGGTMTPVGRMQTMQCVVTYGDAGKACTDGGQCQGDCRAQPDATLREGQSARGVCQATSNRFGCFTTIKGGKAEATLCID